MRLHSSAVTNDKQSIMMSLGKHISSSFQQSVSYGFHLGCLHCPASVDIQLCFLSDP